MLKWDARTERTSMNKEVRADDEELDDNNLHYGTGTGPAWHEDDNHRYC